MRKLIVILGVPIDDLSMVETLDRLEALVRSGRATGRVHQVVTVNTDFLVKASREHELLQILQHSDLASADGMPLVWGARLLGMPLKERVAGADMVPALARRAAQCGFSLYLLGAAPGVAERAAEVLKSGAPGLNIVGIVSPPFVPIEQTNPAILDDIRAKKPDILLVAYGNPKQEKWIHRFGHQVGVPVMIGVGGTLDFIAGRTQRAPEWMRKTGLEWIHRLIKDPRRLWKRYIEDLVVFTALFIRQMWKVRRHRIENPLLPLTDLFFIKDAVIISIQGNLTAENIFTFREMSRNALEVSSNIIVNLEKATFLDSSAIGALIGLYKEASGLGGGTWLASVPSSVLSTFKLLHLDEFFNILPDIHSCLQACRKQIQDNLATALN